MGYLSAAYRVLHRGTAGTSDGKVFATALCVHGKWKFALREEGAFRLRSASPLTGRYFTSRLGGPKEADATLQMGIMACFQKVPVRESITT